MYTDCYWLIDSLISFTIIIIIIIVFLIYSIVMYDCILSIVHLKNKLNWTEPAAWLIDWLIDWLIESLPRGLF